MVNHCGHRRAADSAASRIGSVHEVTRAGVGTL